MRSLTETVRESAKEYGSIPFWSWNDRLEEEELRRQIRNMRDKEMHGFFMHARTGLETEYLSEEWYSCVKACIDEAKKWGMEAWSYDENGWPSGFAGGKLLEDPRNHAMFVTATFSETFPVSVGDNVLGIYAFDENGVPHLTDCVRENAVRYLTVTKGTDASYVDLLREGITEQFLQATHEEYRQKLGSDFGNAMPGFFTDEPQYYRWHTPYSEQMDEWFRQSYGYSVREALPALFCDYPGAEQYRYDYWQMAFRRFTANFSQKLYEWAEKNGVQITGHFIEEQTLAGQMMCCGDIMPQYQYEHIPGIDYLGRGMQTDLAPKQLGSVCAQTGRKKAISEMFACCGWDVTPRELKRIAELQYANGVNVMCQHLYAYSLRGQRKRDYPLFYSEHNLWQKDLTAFDRYFNHLGCLLAMGEEYADVLVIHPIHSAWLTYQREKHAASVAELDQNLADLMYLLSGNQIAYHFGSESMMAEMSAVTENAITVGHCTYHTVVVPACDTLDSTTVRLLKEFQANGGTVYTYRRHLPTRIDGREADLSFLQACRDLSEPSVWNDLRECGEVVVTHTDHVEKQDLRMMVRKTEYGRVIYLTNLSEKDFRGLRVTVKNSSRLGRLDIASLTVSSVAGHLVGNEAEVLLDLSANESAVLVESDAPAFASFIPPESLRCIALHEPFMTDALPQNYLTLDRAYVSLDGGEFSELRPLERIRDELLASRFRGKVTLSFPFTVAEIPSELSVITEPMASDTLTVNGVTVPIGQAHAIDRSFRVTDIAPYLRTGENRIAFCIPYWQRDYVYYVLYGGVSEALRNCLVFDTELENIYLCGNFRLDMKKEAFVREGEHAYRYDPANGMALMRQAGSLSLENLVTEGYPFYCGEVTASTHFSYQVGDATVLRLHGRFATAHVWVNGKEAGSVLFSEYVDLKDHLQEGDNIITVTLCNSYRNLLGPHHMQTAEPMSIRPKAFSFEGQWQNGICHDFDGRYAFVRYGIDR